MIGTQGLNRFIFQFKRIYTKLRSRGFLKGGTPQRLSENYLQDLIFGNPLPVWLKRKKKKEGKAFRRWLRWICFHKVSCYVPLSQKAQSHNSHGYITLLDDFPHLGNYIKVTTPLSPYNITLNFPYISKPEFETNLFPLIKICSFKNKNCSDICVFWQPEPC